MTETIIKVCLSVKKLLRLLGNIKHCKERNKNKNWHLYTKKSLRLMPNHFYDKFIIRKKTSKLDLDIMKKKK